MVDHMKQYLELEKLMLMAEEMGDEPKAEDIRNVMDIVHLNLTDKEHEFLNERNLKKES